MRLLRGLFAGLGLGLALIPVTGALALPVQEVPVTGIAPPQPAGPLASVDDLEAQMLSIINNERAAAGVGAVQMQPWAQGVARAHSQDMAAAGSLWHNLTGFMGPGHSVLGSPFLGENAAFSSTLGGCDGILFSDPPHRAITLDARFNYVGVGVAYGAGNYVYLTEDFAQIGSSGHAAAAPATSAQAAPAPAVTRGPVAPRVAVVRPATPAVQPVAAAPVPTPTPVVVSDTQPAPAPSPVVVPQPVAAKAQPVKLVDARPAGNRAPVLLALGLGVVLLAGLAGVAATTLKAILPVTMKGTSRFKR